MDCSGHDIDAMKIALPDYMSLSYHASAAEAAFTGAVVNHTNSHRVNWGWADRGTEKPKEYHADFNRELLWHELLPTFAQAALQGEATEWDPVAVNDYGWIGRLWKSKNYWLLTGGNVNKSPFAHQEITVKLPELHQDIQHAFEFDMETGKMEKRKIIHCDGNIFISLKSSVSAVFFPFSECPPLLTVQQNSKTISPGDTVKVQVSIFAPWRKPGVDEDFAIKLEAKGFDVAGYKNGEYEIFIPENTSKNDYFFSITGDCLPLKRWFTVK